MVQNTKVEKSNHSLKDTIFGMIFLIQFFFSFIGIIYFSKIEPLMILFIFGIQFTIFGLIFLLKQGINMTNVWILLFPSVGITLLLYSGINIWGYKYNLIFYDEWMITLGLSLFALAGLYVLFYTIYTDKLKKERCSIDVIAICIDLDKSYASKHITYSPIFKYIYKRVEHTANLNSYSNIDVPVVGMSYEIYINPSNPEDIYRPSLKQYITGIVLGSLFLFSGSAILYLRATQN